VDIHGPHDHQSLLHPTRQLDVVDSYGGLHPKRNQLAELLRRQTALQTERQALIIDDKSFAEQLDLLRFQVNEIKAAKLQPGEEEQLQQDFQRASNAARLLRLSQTVLSVLNEEENCLLQQAGLIGRTLQEIQKMDSSAAPLLAIHEQAVGALQELQRETAAYAERLEIDPLRYQELEDRLNLLQGLKRKYGSTASEILAFAEKARHKLTQLEQHDVQLIQLDQQLEQLQKEMLPLATELSTQRRKLAPKLCKAVIRQLTDLGFKQSQFEITTDTKPGSFTASGCDTIEFQFAPNPGEPAHPLRAIASSGELARVMLGLKTVLAAEDQVPVLVFDEVDANVGGQTAHAIGDKMRQIARQRQVLCITHLAPVAAPADAHYLVTKEIQGGRTVSSLQRLEGSAANPKRRANMPKSCLKAITANPR
jgi:DNA repair protein RecN (Recombination protein N)